MYLIRPAELTDMPSIQSIYKEAFGIRTQVPSELTGVYVAERNGDIQGFIVIYTSFSKAGFYSLEGECNLKQLFKIWKIFRYLRRNTLLFLLRKLSPHERIMYIQSIAVRKAQRRQGIAHILLEYCFICAGKTGCAIVALHIQGVNLKARSLYQQRGFAPPLFVRNWNLFGLNFKKMLDHYIGELLIKYVNPS